ncbi:MAG TPA: glycoside hydrolase family 3 C-terminal domain-containing protein [Kineosporiaceae bacterium]|nr:glycoside hydrolase family 3 C-terminal domain-containing protein [Kineosporiaceae bacterium]
MQAVRAGAAPAEAADGLLARMTDAEKLGLLDGDEPFWPGMAQMMGVGYNLEPIVAGAVPRLGVPGIRFSDGPRGAVIGRSTAFPVPMARGATWDPVLEERVGAAIGAEIRAQGGNLFGGVCVNLLRHPAWGRAQETYGEEPALLGAMGAALTRGAQRHVMACVKHYACNSMENARFSVDVRVDEATLHEVYLPHFRDVVEAGVASVMSAYNGVNGEWCGQNRVLLTDVLREEWGFEGLVMSDFVWGLRDPVGSLSAGLDVEMPFAQQRARALPPALASGTASWDDVERAGRRILGTQLRHAAGLVDAAGLTGDRGPRTPGPDVVVSAAHRALAREVAARAMVLLRDESVDGRPLLPLDASALTRLAVLGPLADLPNTGDHGSSDVRAPWVVTPLAGLRDALPGVEIAHADGADVEHAARTAADADVAVVVVGYTAQDEGEYVGSFDPALAALYPPPQDPGALLELARVWEAGPQGVGGDRDSLRLHPQDETLVRAVAAANPRTVVVVMAGAAVTMEGWRHEVPAILLAWYPGMEGGAALADVLLGASEPGGRLPFVIPRDEADLPPFDKAAATVTYDRWFGQRRLDRDAVAPAYPLGFGLSYTSFTIDEARVDVEGDALRVTATVRNTGERAGGHVVQVYAGRPAGDGRERILAGFVRVETAPGGSVAARIEVPLRRLARRLGPARWVVPPGIHRIDVAGNASDPAAVSVTVDLPERRV